MMVGAWSARRIGLACAPAMLSACSLFLDYEGSSAPSPGASDASAAPDGSAEAAYALQVLADNPLVYYRSAAQANGLLVNSGTGGVAYDGESKDLIEERSCALGSGSCASFNGTTSEITIRGQRIDFSAQRPFSFEAWYRLPVRLNDEKWHHLFDRSLPMEKPRVQLAITFHDAEGIGLERWANQADGPGYSGTKPNWDASWHHLVATYDGGMVALYLDGIASPKARHTASLPPFDAPLYVGRTYFGNYFRGIVDEIAVYETALSETRARVHYLAGVR